MKKLIAIAVFLSFCCHVVFAEKAISHPIEVVQPDGKTVNVYLRGDERFHYYETEDGVPLLQVDGKSYYYVAENDGQLTNSGILAHDAIDRTPIEQTFITEKSHMVVSRLEELCDSVNRLNVDRLRAAVLSRATLSSEPSDNYKGKKKGIVILVDFNDVAMSTQDSNNLFDRMFNEPGYNENNHIGSVHDYFLDQSYGQFDLDFDVVGPVTVSEEMSYYGKNNSLVGDTDENVRDMVKEACVLADEYVDYSDYDWNGDGEVDQVFIVYAGYGESNGAPSYTIWPHKSVIKYSNLQDDLVLDGVVINTYACSCELAGTSGGTVNGIGTPCHEFSHCLGLPDLYDVNYSGGFGMDSWDVMSDGNHSGPDRHGEVPCGYSAYERWLAGWLDFVDLSEMERINGMPCVADAPVAYRMVNDAHPDEYFVFENRQNNRWFTFAGESTECHGLMITHIDYSEAAWDMNSVNTVKNHQRVCIVPADNDFGNFYTSGSTLRYNPTPSDLEGDLFPGTHQITEFTGKSHENSGGKLFNQTEDGLLFLDKPITNIKEADGLISFDFMGGIYVPVPKITDVSVVNGNSFSITWEPDGSVDYFVAEATEIKEKSPIENRLLLEDFADFTTESGSGDGVMDISIYMDSYTTDKGWSGRNLHTSPFGVKIGNDVSSGFITTPCLNIANSSMTVVLKGTFDGAVVLSNELNDTIGTKEICVEESKEVYINFDNLESGGYFITVQSGVSPCYMSKITIFDGCYDQDDFTIASLIQYMIAPETITVTSSSSNSCVFESLKAKKYKCRLRASYDEAFSEWTDYIEISLDSFGAISDKELDCRLPICVYDITGKVVSNPHLPGLYIFDYGNCWKKVLVR